MDCTEASVPKFSLCQSQEAQVCTEAVKRQTVFPASSRNLTPPHMFGEQQEPLSCGSRLGVCCVGTSLSKAAYFFSFFFLIIGWCIIIVDWTWTNRHEPAPYHFTFWHIVPGIFVSFGTFILLVFGNAPSEDDESPFGEDQARRRCVSLTEVFACLLCTLVPFMFVLLITHRTWYDPTALPPRNSNDTLYTASYSLEEDEGLRRGIFSSIGGTKTTKPPPPTTTPPPLTWPPFTGPDLIPVAYILHIAALCGSLGLAIVAKMWQAQERKAARDRGEMIMS